MKSKYRKRQRLSCQFTEKVLLDRTTGESFLEVANTTILTADGRDQDNSVDGNSLIEPRTCRPKETAGDIKISEELTYEKEKLER